MHTSLVFAALLNVAVSYPVELQQASFNRTTPPAGALVVSPTGPYKTIQSAVNALSRTSTTAQNLFIFPGTYKEQVYIPKLASYFTIQGSTADARSYQSNTAELTNNLVRANTSTNDLTATLRNWSPNVKIYNLNIVNTFGHIETDGQNLALSAQETGQGYYGCQFRGYQDTILTNKGKQIYAKSLITGAVDFIYGSAGVAWFEKVDIRTIKQGAITASGRDSESNPSYFVINNSNIDGINSSVKANSTYLGRPWRNYARVVFQNSYIGSIVKPDGWSVWSKTDTRTDHASFGEFNNSGPGAVGPRASFSSKFSAAVKLSTLMGSTTEWWVDTSYL